MATSRSAAGTPISVNIATSMAISSASMLGSARPNTSAPTWWNWRRRPRWARSCRNIGPR